ncbi:MAG TPA: DUF2127 domain-containing protein [Chloroflexota bacterium]|nr:DUF2127 domain-containing protein [Chloroflexota bacterium]
MADRKAHTGAGMWLVIISKAITALLLLGGFVMLLLAGNGDPTDVFSKFVAALFKGNPPGFVVAFVVEKTSGLAGGKAFALAAATLAYAALEATEAAGLAARKLWAEWLTIVVTASFLPWEVVELVKEHTALKDVTLAMNLAILAFLIVRRLKERESRRRGSHRIAFAL